MPLFASNFTSNSLSGTVRVSGGAANISFGIEPFAFEGNKTFVVKLRRGSAVGDVIATSNPITINDFSQVLSLTANISTVAEGNLVSLSLVTANVPNNANVFYSVFPVTANVTASDFFGANAGAVTISNNQATFAFYANTDAGFVNEDGETFRVQLRTNGTSGNIVYTTSNIAITDFYKLFNAIGLVETASAIVEGGNVTFTFTGHNIPTGTILYYNTEGNATSSLFTTGNTGSFVMNTTSNTLNLITTTTVPSQETRNFVLRLRSGSATGAVVATSNSIAVVDSSLLNISATGGTITSSNGFIIHTFTTSNNFVVVNSGTGVNATNVEVMVLGAGGGSRTIDGAFGGGGAGGLVYRRILPLPAGTYTVTVGTGNTGNNGGNSSIVGPGLTLIGYGGGRGGLTGGASGQGGGSGGGGAGPGGAGGSSIQTGSPFGGFGNSGGNGGNGITGSYGGGAGGTGASGGAGRSIDISGANVLYGGGGGFGRAGADGGDGGGTPNNLAGGGKGGGGGNPDSTDGVDGLGGGAGAGNRTGGSYGRGGNGIVIVRYAYTPPPSITGFYTLANSYVEGSNIVFNIFTTAANTYTYYYKTVGNVTASDFVGGNTGSFTSNATGATVTLQAGSLPANETRFFALQITEDSLNGAVKATSSNINIIDTGLAVLTATGGTITTSGNYRIHRFTTSGNLVITATGGTTQLEYLAIGGGGGGGGASGPAYASAGGGGGGGGAIMGTFYAPSNTGNITILVGAGGGGGASSPPFYGAVGITGGNSVISGSLIAYGGGAGGTRETPGGTGASGGGGGLGTVRGANVVGQGSIGGQGYDYGARGGAGGGGGYSYRGGDGFNWPDSQDGLGYGGRGGIGLLSNITGSNVEYAGGGGGGAAGNFTANVGVYGGGNGGAPAGSGNVNTGGGGGGGYGNPNTPISSAGGNGGSGIIVIRYLINQYPLFNGLAASSGQITQGANITFTANITNANGYVYYYRTVGNVISSDFIGGNTGSFTANATGGVITLQSNSAIGFAVGETRYFALQIVEDSISGFARLTSANVNVLDPTKLAAPNVNYLSVAGGGGGGGNRGGGGGGGGMLFGTFATSPSTYTVTVGAGGRGWSPIGDSLAGSNTIIQGGSTTITSVGGGRGGGNAGVAAGGNGGSGGGGGSIQPGGNAGGGYGYPGTAGSTQQGFPGGTSNGSPFGNGGGGGGASSAGTPADGGGTGGNGAPSLITGANVIYAGGGLGVGPSSPLASGTINTGDGGTGGDGVSGTAGTGGSGVVVMSHPNAFRTAVTTGANVVVSTVNSNVIYKFYSSGTISF